MSNFYTRKTARVAYMRAGVRKLGTIVGVGGRFDSFASRISVKLDGEQQVGTYSPHELLFDPDEPDRGKVL